MKTSRLLILALAASFAAHADFSYTQTSKSSMGAGAPSVTKYYYKGSRILSDTGNTARIMDFGAQTMTTIDKTAKTYSVQKIGDMMPAGAATPMPEIEVKETGLKKTVNGFNCTQVMMTISMDSPAPAPPGMKMNMEMEMWISPDVRGWESMRAFFQKNAYALTSMGGGNPSMQKAMTEMQKKMMSMNGMPVEEIMRVRMGGGAAAAMGQAAGDPRMAQARARLEALIAQGGPGADAAKQALARMPGGGGGPGAPMFETTMDSTEFSTADVPDSMFAVPAGYTQK